MASIRSRIRDRHVIDEPRAVKWLFRSPAAAWFWLLPRLWIGWHWVQAGEQKVLDPDWVRTGVALRSHWWQIVAAPDSGQPGISFDWYRVLVDSLLRANAYRWIAPLLAWGEVFLGVALMIGALTGIAMFCGAFVHWDLTVAGSAGTNPLLFVFAIGLILAWRVAGYVGLDYFLLPWLGAPRPRHVANETPKVRGPGVQTFWATDPDDIY